MTLNGPMSAYKESLAATGRAVMPAQFSSKVVRHRDLCEYARKKGVPISGLDEGELANFVWESPQESQTSA